jgi:hypothetical protein
MNYKIKRLSDNCIEVRCVYKVGFSQDFFLSADWHLDNPKCNRKLLTNHLNEAKEKEAGIFVFGDLFCAMQGKYDKRSSKSDIRPEHQSGKYLDKLVSTTYDFCEPYSDNFVLVSPGNHETAITKRHETDLTQRLIEKLKDANKSPIEMGRYSGWIRFVFEHESGGNIKKFNLFYHHGYGGGGPVTKGVIQTNRRGIYLPDATFIVGGHVHERWEVDIMRERLKQSGKTVIDTQRHIQLPTYKEEYLQHGGWHVERGAPPKPLGGAWLRFFEKGSKIKYQNFWAE